MASWPDPSGQGKDPCLRVLTQADAGCPAGQVVGHRRWQRRRPEGRWFSPTVQGAYRILKAWRRFSLQFQGLVPVGDEAVIAVGGEESQLGTGRRLHPPDDEPHRRGVGLTLDRAASWRRPP